MRLYAERRGRGQSVPPHPLGRYAEAPAAGLCPSAARREFPKSRLAAGAMLIAPILFIVCSVQGSQAAPWAAVSWGVGRLGPLKKMENAVSSRLFRSVCMLSAPRLPRPTTFTVEVPISQYLWGTLLIRRVTASLPILCQNLRWMIILICQRQLLSADKIPKSLENNGYR